MSLRSAIPLRVGVLALLVACGPPPMPEGPRATGAGSSAFVSDGKLTVGYRYDPKPGKTMQLYVDLTGDGDVGNVAVKIVVDGLDVLEGKTSFDASVGPKTSYDLLLGTPRDGAGKKTATITVVTRHVAKDIELTSDALRFLLDAEEGIRECRPTDEVCGQ